MQARVPPNLPQKVVPAEFTKASVSRLQTHRWLYAVSFQFGIVQPRAMNQILQFQRSIKSIATFYIPISKLIVQLNIYY